MFASLPVAALLLAAPASAPPADFLLATAAWQERRVKRLTADDGWLTLVALLWLKEGENTAGSAKDVAVVFPPKAPAHLGTFTRRGNAVGFEPAPGATVTRSSGQPFTGGPLRSDAEEDTDELQAGGLRFHVVVRGDRVGLRVKDPEAPARTQFRGIPTYPVDPRWRIEARWEPSAAGSAIPVPTVLGTVDRMPSPGTAVFTIDGKEYRLTPVLEEGEKDLFFIFADATNRTETYGAGRFLYAGPPSNGRVILDFNRAYNPPCAFSAYATCPLPPKQNRLPIPVAAGEKRYSQH